MQSQKNSAVLAAVWDLLSKTLKQSAVELTEWLTDWLSSLFPLASVAQCRPSAPLHCSSRHELVPAVCAGRGLPARHEAQGPHPPGPQTSKVRVWPWRGSQRMLKHCGNECFFYYGCKELRKIHFVPVAVNWGSFKLKCFILKSPGTGKIKAFYCFYNENENGVATSWWRQTANLREDLE